MVETLKKGLISGLSTTWALGKIIFPITLLVTILQHTPVLQWVIKAVSPLMNLIGLSGDAAIPLVLGYVLNIYAAIGAILTLDFTVKEVFILAMMLSFCHNLLVETSVAAKVGVKVWLVLLVRLGLSILAAIVIHFFWNGGTELATYGFVPASNEHFTSWWAIFLNGLETASIGILQLAMVVFPLMIGIQILKDLKWLDTFSRWMGPVTRMLGMKENTTMTLAAGILFGLAFGAGVMIEAAKEDDVEKKDLTLAIIFLVACHAVVEDTLIFIPLGIPVWPLLVIRIFVAVLLTMAISRTWNKFTQGKRKEASYGH